MQIRSESIEMVDVNALVPHPKNCHEHPKEQIERLSKIIEYQGFRNPLTVQAGTNLIVTGHGRLMAAKKLGMKEVPVIYQEFESEEQLYAHLVADNAIGKDTWATLDLSAINLELENLGPDLDIDMLGLKDFVLEPAEKLDPKTDEDEVPEVENPITKRGDIWLLGNHRVMCGDSTMIDDVEKLMNGERADMVFTDPPYGMNLDTSNKDIYFKDQKADGEGKFTSKTSSIGARRTTNYRKIIGDDQDFIFDNFYNLVNDIKEQFWWGADYYCQSIPKNGSFMVWDKTGGNDSLMDAGFGSNYELAWSKQKHKRDLIRYTYKGVSGMKKEDGRRVHPSQKPVGLCEYFIKKWSKNTVIDMFLGSGSTLIACEKTNRKCYGMELDENYCDVIINRWQNYTGKEAVLESTGESYNSLKEKQDATA